MTREITRATFKVVVPGLVAGGICGATVGLGYVAQPVGIALAIVVGVWVGFSVLWARRRVKTREGASSDCGAA